MSFIAACVQSTATPDVHADIRVLTDFIRAAAAKGARFIATPEYCAGLDTKGAQSYGGWESPTSLLRGHITGGHFLSAAAQMVNATGDAGLKATLAYMVGELAACQTANAALFGAGYLGAYPCVPLDRASASPAARPTHPGP